MNKCKLGEIAEIINGATPSTKKAEYWDGNIVWITPKDLADQKSKYIYTGERRISQEGFKKNNLTLLPPNSILLTSRAPIGLMSINKVECCTNQGFKSLIVNKNKCDTEYLYYYLKLHIDEIKHIGSGTTFREVSRASLYNYEIILPDLNVQKRIANTLKSIDDKIGNNNKVNDELENIAKTIYDYWFLQFEFPNEEGKPYKSSGGKMVWNEELKQEIPDKWRVCHAKDIVNVVTGKEDANHSTTNGKYPFFTCSNNVLKCDDYKFDGKAILIAGNGDFNIKYYEGKFNAYQRTYVLIPADRSKIGLLYQSAIRTIEKFSKGSNGSIVKFITKSDVENIPLFVPTLNVNIEIFNIILNEIQHNKMQNQQLISLRDFLLPLLMNGQVGFKEDSV